jgi:transcriptional regulator with GAF, ATPase, and Fis domain
MLKVELNLIISSLKKANGNQRRAAEILGIKPTTLHEKMKRHNIKQKIVAFYDLKID